MQTLAQVLADFGHEMGMSGTLAPGEGGGVQLRLESGAVLGVARQGEAVVVHLSEPAPYDAPQRLIRAMKLAGAPGSAALPLQPGLRETPEGRWLVLATRLPLAECTAPRLLAVWSRLRDAHEGLK